MNLRVLPICLLLAACSGDDESPRMVGAAHLDPRLEDGRSSTEALDRPAQVSRRFTIASEGMEEPFTKDLAPFEWHNTIGRAPGSATEGLMVRAKDYKPQEGIVHAYATWPEAIDAAGLNRIEVDLWHGGASSAALTWRTNIAGIAPGEMRAEVGTSGGKVETVVFDLSSHEAWRGTITDLHFYPCWRGPQSFELIEVRFGWSGFSPGAHPSATVGDEGGDAGLLGIRGDLRRTWVSDRDVPLFCSTPVVPEGGKVVAEVCVHSRWNDSGNEAVFAVDVEAEDGWKQVVEARFTLAGDREWVPVEAELADYVGHEVSLRLRAGFGNAGTEGALETGDFWWGAPLLIGDTVEDHTYPNILLFTLDTLRTDAMGCYGGADVTPFLDSLANEGLLFEEAYAACNSTLPSHTSMLTGLPVPTHGVVDNGATLAGEVRTLAQSLRKAGFHTAAAVSVVHLGAKWSGLGRGFDQYLDTRPGAPVNGALTLDVAKEWGSTWSAQGERPVFLWVHLFDPHTPYGPPEPFASEFAAKRGAPSPTADPPTIGISDYTRPGGFLDGITSGEYARYLYEASVAYTDHIVEDFVDSWKSEDRWDRTMCIVTSDHGESLGEENVWYGHQVIHQPVMQVPLIVRDPGRSPDRISARAWNPDLVKTITDRFGLTDLHPLGRSLFELGEHKRRVWFVHANMLQVGCRDEDVYYWHNLVEYDQLGPERASPRGANFVYRPTVDPGMLSNLADADPDLAAKYVLAMQDWMSRTKQGRRVKAALTSEDRESLDAMGYGGHGEDD